MGVIVDLCVVPIGVGVHLAPSIAAREKVLTDAGLKVEPHLNGTAIEGEWEPGSLQSRPATRRCTPWAAPASTPP